MRASTQMKVRVYKVCVYIYVCIYIYRYSLASEKTYIYVYTGLRLLLAGSWVRPLLCRHPQVLGPHPAQGWWDRGEVRGPHRPGRGPSSRSGCEAGSWTDQERAACSHRRGRLGRWRGGGCWVWKAASPRNNGGNRDALGIPEASSFWKLVLRVRWVTPLFCICWL